MFECSSQVRCGMQHRSSLLLVRLRFQLRHMQRQTKKAMPRLNVSKLVSGRTGDAAVTKGLHDAVRHMLQRDGMLIAILTQVQLAVGRS